MPEIYENVKKKAADAKAAALAIPGGMEAARRSLRDACRTGSADPVLLLDAVCGAGVDGMPILRDAVLALTGQDLDAVLDVMTDAVEERRAEEERMAALREIPNAIVQIMDACVGLLPVQIPDEVLSSDNPTALLDAMRILSKRDNGPAPAWWDIMRDPDAVPGVLYVPCTSDGSENLPIVKQNMYPVPRASKYMKQARNILKKS